MAPLSQDGFEARLIKVREYVKLHKASSALACSLSDANSTDGLITVTFQGQQRTAVLLSQTPEKPQSFLVLIDEWDDMVLSGNAQFYIYHLYRLENGTTETDKENWNYYWWKLVEELRLTADVVDKSNDDIADIVIDLIGDRITEMK